jgi:hypothetical protein
MEWIYSFLDHCSIQLFPFNKRCKRIAPIIMRVHSIVQVVQVEDGLERRLLDEKGEAKNPGSAALRSPGGEEQIRTQKT